MKVQKKWREKKNLIKVKKAGRLIDLTETRHMQIDFSQVAHLHRHVGDDDVVARLLKLKVEVVSSW